jgi:ribosomal protein S18 acetylase RimI-like enzyme
MNYKIRNAIPSDIAEIINLCAEHAEYEEAVYSPEGKKEKLANFLFGVQPRLFCLIAENGFGIVGYATYMFEFSTWDAGHYVHMDCLYLRPHARGYRIGEALIQEIARQTKVNDCQLIQWQTPVSNERAIKFYYRIGATSKHKLRLYLHEESIKNLIK